jgi:hypothetical protein
MFIVLSGCSGPSKDEVKSASEECVRFYKEKRADNGETVEYRAHWMKSGRLVISLAVKENWFDNSYTEGLCVVDLKERTMLVPGLFNQSKWEK